MVIVGCGAEQADSGSPEASAATNASAAEGSEGPSVPEFCTDEEGRGLANLVFQLLPQMAASPDGGKSQFENPIFTGPDFHAVERHLDARRVRAGVGGRRRR